MRYQKQLTVLRSRQIEIRLSTNILEHVNTDTKRQPKSRHPHTDFNQLEHSDNTACIVSLSGLVPCSSRS
jgi:hypothetical protein